jgi:protein involved in polysaccharide export with SLBB domain
VSIKYYSKLLTSSIFSLLLLVLPVLSQTEPTATPAATPETPATARVIQPEKEVLPEDLIHYGDVVEIDVVGSLEYDWQGKMNPEGYLAELSFAADPVPALCQTEESVAQKIAAAYSKYLRNPQVTVKIIDRSDRPVTMFLGAVKNRQRFLLKRAVKLNELVFLAGGITDSASGEISIFRPDKLGCTPQTAANAISVKISDLIAGKPDANPLIRTGDIVTVQESPVVYVTGGVANPQKIFARQEMTVSRAIASSGNPVKGANTKNITIYRRDGGSSSVIDVDLDKILAKQAEDVILKPFDVVDVPKGAKDPKKQSPIIAGAENFATDPASLPLVIVD